MNFKVSSNDVVADDDVDSVFLLELDDVTRLPLEDVVPLFTGWLLFVGCVVVGGGVFVAEPPWPYELIDIKEMETRSERRITTLFVCRLIGLASK